MGDQSRFLRFLIFLSVTAQTKFYTSQILSLDEVFERHNLPGSAVPLANLRNNQQWQTLTGDLSLEAYITDIAGQIVVFFKSSF
jgi:hypothetical protein